MSDGTELAKPGKVWLCGACGKRSRTRYGFVRRSPDDRQGSDFTPDGRRVADLGWDASCALNAALVDEAQP